MTDPEQEVRTPLVDEWYVKEYAYSTTVAGLRGNTAVKAINKLDDEDAGVPVMVGPAELQDYDEAVREDVPKWGREHVEEQFRVQDKNFTLIRQAGGSDA